MNKQYVEELARALAKELANNGLLIEVGWFVYNRYAKPVMPIDAKMAFYAGAQHLFASMMNTLDDDREPTEADLKRLNLINSELEEFLPQLEAFLKECGQRR